MTMPFPSTPEFNPLAEQYVERWALEMYRSATFTHSLRAYYLAPSMSVTTPKGKMLAVRAEDVYGTLKKFLKRLDLAAEPCRLTQMGEPLVYAYQDWLLHEYTDRYRYLTTPEQRHWLEQVVILSVVRRLMEHKSHVQGRETYADPWVCSEMYYLQMTHEMPSEQARLAHHILRDPARAEALIEQFFDQLDVRMHAHQFGPPAPLPPLPEGARLPLVRLMPGRNADEQ